MKIKFTRPTIYCSHSIRGADGNIEGNCLIAKKVGTKLRSLFPEVDFYIPADSDLALQILWKERKLTTEDIMYADLKILGACHGWFWYCTGWSEGCHKEQTEAHHLGLAELTENVITADLLKANYEVTRRIMTPIIKDTIKRFRKD